MNALRVGDIVVLVCTIVSASPISDNSMQKVDPDAYRNVVSIQPLYDIIFVYLYLKTYVFLSTESK